MILAIRYHLSFLHWVNVLNKWKVRCWEGREIFEINRTRRGNMFLFLLLSLCFCLFPCLFLFPSLSTSLLLYFSPSLPLLSLFILSRLHLPLPLTSPSALHTAVSLRWQEVVSRAVVFATVLSASRVVSRTSGRNLRSCFPSPCNPGVQPFRVTTPRGVVWWCRCVGMGVHVGVTYLSCLLLLLHREFRRVKPIALEKNVLNVKWRR